MNRLLLVSEPGRDGVFIHFRGFIEYLHRQHPEITVDLAYSSKRGSPALQELVKDVEARGGKTADLHTGNAPQPADLRACREILRLVREGRPQIVHAQSSKAGGLCRVLKAMRPGFPPVVYTPHAYFGVSGKKSPITFVFNLAERILEPFGNTVVISTDERDFALQTLRISPQRLNLIHNGIDLRQNRHATPEEKKAARDEFGLPHDVPVVVSIGRRSFQKNYGPLYVALDRILTDPALPCFFAHAGDGSEELGQTLSPEARRRFKPFPFISAIERFLYAADAFILASRYEGLSLSVMDSATCGLKLILSRVPGNRCMHTLGFDEVSWIEPTEDAKEMSRRIEEALRAWLAHPTPASDAQIRLAREHFDQETQYEKVVQLYEQIIRKA